MNFVHETMNVKTGAEEMQVLLNSLHELESASLDSILHKYPVVPWILFLLNNRWAALKLMVSKGPNFQLTPYKLKQIYEKRWSGYYDSSIHETARTQSLKPYLVNGLIRYIPETVFTMAMTKELMKIFGKYISNQSTVIELGMGSGRNLFTIQTLFPNAFCYGAELSEAGIREATMFANRSGFQNITMRQVDLTDTAQMANFSKEIQGNRRIVMTIGVLEGIREQTQQAIDNIRALQPSLVIHWEPLFELFRGGFLTQDYFNRKRLIDYGYLDSLYTKIKKLENQQKAKIIECRRLGLGKAFYEQSLLVWSPI